MGISGYKSNDAAFKAYKWFNKFYPFTPSLCLSQGKRLPAYLSADAEEGEVSDDDSADEIEDDFKLKSSNVRETVAINMTARAGFFIFPYFSLFLTIVLQPVVPTFSVSEFIS